MFWNRKHDFRRLIDATQVIADECEEVKAENKKLVADFKDLQKRYNRESMTLELVIDGLLAKEELRLERGE